ASSLAFATSGASTLMTASASAFVGAPSRVRSYDRVARSVAVRSGVATATAGVSYEVCAIGPVAAVPRARQPSTPAASVTLPALARPAATIPARAVRRPCEESSALTEPRSGHRQPELVAR